MNEPKIRLLEDKDVGLISEAFAQIGWDKPVSLFEGYLSEQKAGHRLVLVAYVGDEFVGYLTIKWESSYPPFKRDHIPEIKDLNVLPQFRRRGIATALLKEAEKRVGERSSIVGIGVGMSPDYGAAQRLYAILGYIPDGRGLFLVDRHVRSGDSVSVDRLIQYLTKTLWAKVSA